MAWTMPIADAGSGIFWLVVVLFVIISKIVKATKKDAPPPAGSPKPRTPASTGEFSPEEELRDFLKRLSQDADQPPPIPQPVRPAAKPPPLPTETIRTTTSSQPGSSRPRTPQPVHAQPAPKTRPVSHRHATRAPVVVQAPPAPQPEVAWTAPEPVRAMAPAAPIVPTAADKRRADLVAFLRDRGCLREAILLREILDAPLAMRRQATHVTTG